MFGFRYLILPFVFAYQGQYLLYDRFSNCFSLRRPTALSLMNPRLYHVTKVKGVMSWSNADALSELCSRKRIFQTSAHKPKNQCKHQQLRGWFPICEKCIFERALSFHLSWVLGPFVHGRLQNQKTSEDTFGYGITPLNRYWPAFLPTDFPKLTSLCRENGDVAAGWSANHFIISRCISCECRD